MKKSLRINGKVVATESSVKREVKSLQDIERELDPEDQMFIGKIEKNYGKKSAKATLKEMDDSFRKGPTAKYGRNYFKKD